MGPEHVACQVAKVVGGDQCGLDALSRGGAGGLKCLRCEHQEPLIELVNRRGDISLPELRFVRVDPLWHSRRLLHFLRVARIFR